MRSFVTASSQRLVAGAAVVAVKPFTVAGWFTAVDEDEDTLFAVGRGSGGGSRDTCYVTSAGGASGNVAMFQFDAGSFSGDLHPTVLANDTLAHFVAVFSDTETSTLYLNGVPASITMQGSMPVGMDQTCIGAFIEPDGTFVNHGSGRQGEIAVWDGALNADEAAALYKGWSPIFIRRASLLAHWRLEGHQSPEPDWLGGFPLTLVNTPTKGDHLQVILPPLGFFPGDPTVAAGGGFAAASQANVLMTGVT